MTTVHAWAAPEAGAPFQPFEYELGPIGHDDVEIEVDHCGICHSDLSMRDNAWGITTYPFVGGHEIEGRIVAVGSGVSPERIGQRVGVGWISRTDPDCPMCISGRHNLSPTQEGVIVGRHGGFADRVRAQSTWTYEIPEGIPAGEAGPLFCGGATVWTPFHDHAHPTHRIGVVGIGGLGHMALRFARAWGCHVTAFTTSENKRAEAMAMGAHDVVVSADADALAARAGTLDLLVTTQNVPIDWTGHLQMLRPDGWLHIVGAVLEPIPVSAFDLIMSHRRVTGTPTSNPASIHAMVEFAARHGIAPTTEHFPVERINEAFDKVAANRVRYRAVLDLRG
jgi:uncharacterized zinc-type alcohol dehydrogenase-like protein